MTYIIIKRPHPLDRIWNGLPEGVQQAFEAADAIPDDPDAPGDVDLDAADAAYRTARDRLAKMLTMPARNLNDVLMKLDVMFDEDGERISGSLQPVLDEFHDLLEVGLGAGREYERTHARHPASTPAKTSLDRDVVLHSEVMRAYAFVRAILEMDTFAHNPPEGEARVDYEACMNLLYDADSALRKAASLVLDIDQ